MTDTNIVLESSLKVGSDTCVGTSCSTQTAPLSEVHEAVALNPQGSATVDGQQASTNILRPKKSLNISTFNIRTGREDWRIRELAQLMDQFKISVIAIQEHRRIHKEEIKYEEIDNHLLVTSSASRNSAQAATGGVGILRRKHHNQRSVK